MRGVVTVESIADIIADHVSNCLAAMAFVQEITRQRRRRDLGDVLMFRDRQHLGLRQSAQADAIFEIFREENQPPERSGGGGGESAETPVEQLF